MEGEKERVEGELEMLLQLHSEVVRPVKCSGDDSPPLHSQDLAEELLLSSSSMLCVEIHGNYHSCMYVYTASVPVP